MPVLVRWVVEDNKVTIRAERMVTSSILDDHIMLQGVTSINDPEHPDLGVHTIMVRKSDIEYVAEALIIEELQKPDEVPDPPKPTKASKPKTTKPRKSRSKSAKE